MEHTRCVAPEGSRRPRIEPASLLVKSRCARSMGWRFDRLSTTGQCNALPERARKDIHMICHLDTIDPARLAGACGGQQAQGQSTTSPEPLVKSRWMFVHDAPVGATEIYCNQGHNPAKCSSF